MRKFATILSVAVLALGFLGADAQDRLPTVVEGFSRDSFVFEQNLAQDYCAEFRKGGKRAGQLGQANGTQIFTGICSNTPQGEIPIVDHMPSSLILEPRDGQKIRRNKKFDVTVQTKNFELGFFSDPTIQYNVFPQELNNKGFIKGHQHISIQFLGKNKKSIKIPDATVFAFFKGLNLSSKNGKLTVPVELGLSKPGIYRCCTLIASFAHSGVVLPKAQRGASDDCVRFEIY